jgi:hypothetical protein
LGWVLNSIEKVSVLPTIINDYLNETLNIYEETALILYTQAIRGKKIDSIIPIYYPLYLVEAGDERSLVIDPFNNKKIELKYIVPDITILDKLLSSGIDDEGYNALLRINDVLKSYYNKINSLHEKLSIEKIICERTILSEIEEIIGNASREVINGYVIRIDDEGKIEKSILEIIESVKIFMKLIGKTIDYLNITVEKANDLTNNIIDETLRRHSSLHGKIDRSVIETQKLIREKIEYLGNRMNTELKNTSEKYNRIIEGLMIRARILDDEIRRLRTDYRSEKYTDIVKNMEDEREKILSRIKELRKKSVKDMEFIKRKYMRMIKIEQRRLELLENEKSNVDRRTQSSINKCVKEFLEIKMYSEKISARLHSYIEDLMKKTILIPVNGFGKYYLRIYIVKSGKHVHVITPAKLVMSSINPDKYFLKYYQNLRKYLLGKNIVKELIKGVKGRDNNLLKYDLLSKLNIEDYKNILVNLSRKHHYLSGINIYLLSKYYVGSKT